MAKIMRLLTAISAVSIMALSASATQAKGLYIGLGGYQSSVDYEGFDDKDTVPAAFLGYTFVDTNILMLAAEVGYYDLGKMSGENINIDAEALTGAGVLSIPIGPIFEVYAKAGMASISVDIEAPGGNFDDDGEEAFYGAGMSFDILDTVDIYTEYLTFDTEVDSEMIGVGVKLAF